MSETQTENAQPKLPPAIQQVVDKAKAEGKTVTIDDQNNVIIGDAPNNVTPIGEKPKGPTKADLKRQAAFVERVRRTMNKHKCDEKQAVQRIQHEDYMTLPAKEHVIRLENAIGNAIQGVAKDIMALKQNDSSIADSFDVNYRGIAALFTEYHLRIAALTAIVTEKLGVTEAEIEAKLKTLGEDKAKEAADLQKNLMHQAHAEFVAAQEEDMKAKMAAHKKQVEEAEKKRMDAEAAKSTGPSMGIDADQPGEAPPAPPEATEFGG